MSTGIIHICLNRCVCVYHMYSMSHSTTSTIRCIIIKMVLLSTTHIYTRIHRHTPITSLIIYMITMHDGFLNNESRNFVPKKIDGNSSK